MTHERDSTRETEDTPSGIGNRLLSRERELRGEGLSREVASWQAWSEHLLTEWPESWGDDLQVLIYGDFLAPPEVTHFNELGITVFPESLESTVIRSARTVLRARVSVSEKSMDAVADAARRLDLLVGTWFVVEWGNTYIGWWSHLTHGSSGGVLSGFPGNTDLEGIATKLALFDRAVQQKVGAALYWLREPRRGAGEWQRSDVLSRYHGLSNAFEILVDAICMLVPADTTLDRDEQQRRIDALLEQANGLTPNDVRTLHHEVTNPGFPVKAAHALRVRFREEADSLVELFFKGPPRDRLYQIRNDMAHGNVDIEDPSEIVRIEEKLSDLLVTVLAMLGMFLPFSYPVRMEPRA